MRVSVMRCAFTGPPLSDGGLIEHHPGDYKPMPRRERKGVRVWASKLSALTGKVEAHMWVQFQRTHQLVQTVIECLIDVPTQPERACEFHLNEARRPRG